MSISGRWGRCRTCTRTPGRWPARCCPPTPRAPRSCSRDWTCSCTASPGMERLIPLGTIRRREDEMAALVTIVVVLVVLALLVLALSVRIVQQYEKGVLFRLGRVIGVREPGLTLIVPLIDILRRVSLRIVTMPIQSQGIIPRDNVSIDVSAVAYYHVVDATKSVVAIESVAAAINQIAQTTLRKVVGQNTLDQTQAEAEREKRAKIIAAEGESLAADQLGAASDIMVAHPLALQLRNLQSLVEIGVDKNTTVVFPAPLMSTIQELGGFLAREAAAVTTSPTPSRAPFTVPAAEVPAAVQAPAASD